MNHSRDELKVGKGTNRAQTFLQRSCFCLCTFAAQSKGNAIMEMTLENTATMAPVSLTEGAVSQLNLIRQQENIPADYCLRLGVKGGGCSGFSYVLGFDQATDSDDTFEIGGLRVVMNKAHAIYLLGMEVDFHNGLDNSGFTFDNPNAKSTCGCGTSFSA